MNIVSTADLQQPVDIHAIAELPYTIHDSKIYGGKVTYLKIPDMYGKVTIFPSGKMISIGTKSPEQAASDLRYAVKQLTENKLIKEIIIDPNLRNIVAVTTVRDIPSIEDIADIIGAMYEPEQFPGAILKTEETKATYLIFQSGKIVVCGTNNIMELEKAVEHINQLLSALK